MFLYEVGGWKKTDCNNIHQNFLENLAGYRQHDVSIKCRSKASNAIPVTGREGP
jgi:hypothetical protein